MRLIFEIEGRVLALLIALLLFSTHDPRPSKADCQDVPEADNQEDTQKIRYFPKETKKQPAASSNAVS